MKTHAPGPAPAVVAGGALVGAAGGLALLLWACGVSVADLAPSAAVPLPPALALAFVAARPLRPGRLSATQARAYVAAAVGAVLLLLGGGWFYRSQRDLLCREAETQLEAITRLKVAEIAEWRRERLADAHLVHRTPYAARRALDVMGAPGSQTTRLMFTGWLHPLLLKGPYRQALVLDAQLDVRLVYPEGAGVTLCPEERRAAETALSTRQVAVADLHRQGADGPVRLSLMVPFVVRREGDRETVPSAGLPAAPDERSAGILVLQCEARDYLFPALQSWPLRTRTAEIQLVRREGSAALVLNDLRHRRDAALQLRIPVARRDSPAAMAVRGQHGVVRGLDYRGVEVLAVARPIPRSPWFMVAKLDRAEAFAAWRSRSTLILLLGGGLLLLFAVAAMVVWQQQEKIHYRALFEAEAARRRSEERYLALFESAREGIAIIDAASGVLLECNPALCQMVERGKAELTGQPQAILYPSGEVLADPPAASAGPPETTEPAGTSWLQAKSGRRVPVDIVTGRLQLGGRECVLSLCRDVTERQRTADALRLSLAEKVVLLREVHHRVKNNLQIVASLLSLQAARTQQPEALAALQDTRTRVHSMALLHEVLYRSPSVARVDLAAYAQEIGKHLLHAHGDVAGLATVRYELLPVGLSLEVAVPCGLIINELVSNALKHGMVKGRAKVVTVALQRFAERQFVLRVSDDGSGLPPGLKQAPAGSLGLQLVANLAGQLGGRLVMEQPPTGGAAFAVLFPVPADAVIEENA